MDGTADLRNRPAAWGWCGSWTLCLWGFVLCHRYFELVPKGKLSVSFMYAVAFVSVFMALFQRYVALPPVPRLLTITAVASARFAMWPAVSVLGQPLEATLVTAALLIGELLGHPLELRQRNTFVHEASSAASPAPSPERPSRSPHLSALKASPTLDRPLKPMPAWLERLPEFVRNAGFEKWKSQGSPVSPDSVNCLLEVNCLLVSLSAEQKVDLSEYFLARSASRAAWHPRLRAGAEQPSANRALT